MTEPLRPARYSGTGRTGICICGHSWEEHHLSVVMREGAEKVHNGSVEYYIPEECEHFGFDEMGGLDAAGNDHCFRYRDSALPDEHN